ncbi:rhomboid family intramembrane serine protease [bacterium]|nr:rhomboid family intramembrane serine protease [bacterium]
MRYLPPATARIMAVTAAVFVLQQLVHWLSGVPWLDMMGCLFLRTPNGLPWWQVWRIFSYALLHYDFVHLFLNMLGLWLVGASVEEEIGSRLYYAVYAAGIVLGGISAIICAALGLGGAETTTVLMGASAGTMCILFTYIAMNPQNTIYLWMIILLPIKSLYLGIIMVIWQAIGLLLYSASQTSYSAHLGGIIAGFLAALALRNNWDTRLSAYWQQLSKKWKRRHIRVVK